MKSLEIINRNIKLFKKMLYELKDTEVGTREDFKKYNLECELKELQLIKQDLEVLEIIRNKEVDISWFKECFEVVTLKIYSMEDALEKYNDYKKKLTLEEAIKIKQWLEANDK